MTFISTPMNEGEEGGGEQGGGGERRGGGEKGEAEKCVQETVTLWQSKAPGPSDRYL